MNRLKLAGLIVLCSLFQPLQADVLMLDAIESEPSNSAEGIKRPTRGMTAEQVYAKFGKPLEELEAVGEPPITRWVYDKYKVYFEYDRVLRTVIIRKPSN